MFVQDRRPSDLEARFALWDLDVQPEPAVLAGETTVTAGVKNIGQLEGAHEAVFSLDGDRVGTDTVTLAPDQADTVSFTTTPDRVGEHVVEVGRLRGRFAVTYVFDGFLPPVANLDSVGDPILNRSGRVERFR